MLNVFLVFRPDAAATLRLSTREREVLQLIAEGKSAKEIAHIPTIAVKTVTFHRESVRRKLGLKYHRRINQACHPAGFDFVEPDKRSSQHGGGGGLGLPMSRFYRVPYARFLERNHALEQFGTAQSVYFCNGP